MFQIWLWLHNFVNRYPRSTGFYTLNGWTVWYEGEKLLSKKMRTWKPLKIQLTKTDTRRNRKSEWSSLCLKDQISQLKAFSKRKIHAQIASLANSTTRLEEVIPIIYELFQKIEKESLFPNSFYEASITLIAKSKMLQENHIRISLMDINTKLLNRNESRHVT